MLTTLCNEPQTCFNVILISKQPLWLRQTQYFTILLTMSYFLIQMVKKNLFSDVFQNRCEFCNIQRKTPVLESLFNKFADFSPVNLCEKVSNTCVFVSLAKFLRIVFSIEHLWWLLLMLIMIPANNVQAPRLSALKGSNPGI